MSENMKNSKIYVDSLVDLNQNVENADKDNIAKNIDLDKVADDVSQLLIKQIKEENIKGFFIPSKY
ncbi:MAG: hypothetical protein ACP5MW_05010 [Thermoplasmata archaeon]